MSLHEVLQKRIVRLEAILFPSRPPSDELALSSSSSLSSSLLPAPTSNLSFLDVREDPIVGPWQLLLPHRQRALMILWREEDAREEEEEVQQSPPAMWPCLYLHLPTQRIHIEAPVEFGGVNESTESSSSSATPSSSSSLLTVPAGEVERRTRSVVVPAWVEELEQRCHKEMEQKWVESWRKEQAKTARRRHIKRLREQEVWLVEKVGCSITKKH